MRRGHFERFRPLCPRCHGAGTPSALQIGPVAEARGDVIMQGVLVCTDAACLSEYPIIDGIPILVADLRAYVAQHVLPILTRDDLSPALESLLGDCLGPATAFDAQRQHLSTYVFDHWGEHDAQPAGNDVTGSDAAGARGSSRSREGRFCG